MFPFRQYRRRIHSVNGNAKRKKGDVVLSKINYGNESWVEKNKRYTLQILSQEGDWKDLQSQIASKDSIIRFPNIPEDQLFLLRCDNNHKRLERPFIWRDKTVKWY